MQRNAVIYIRIENNNQNPLGVVNCVCISS